MGQYFKCALLFMTGMFLEVVCHAVSRYPERFRNSPCCPEQALIGTGLKCCIVGKDSFVYFTGTHICCDGVLKKKISEKAVCCGKTSYCTTSQICCQGKVFNKNTHICCDGKVQVKTFANLTRCCGSDQYDMNTHICCDGKVHKNPGAPSICCGGKVKVGGFCCGSKHFPFLEPVSKFACCEEKFYEPEHQLCCNGQVENFHSNIGNHALCCNGTQYHSLLNGCCSGALFNLDTDICCNKNIITKWAVSMDCCGSDAFDDNKYICCDGTIFYKPPNLCKPACCGKNVYDMKTHICCNGMPFKQEFGPFTKCCRGKTYDNAKQICCGGKALTNRLSCCNKKKYNPNNRGCCSGVIYKTSNHMCCAGKVAKNPYGLDGRCCRDKVYDYETELCCANTITKRKKQPGQESCCGSKLYDTEEEVCCLRDHSLVKTWFGSSKTSCCGTRPYLRSKLCCQDKIALEHAYLCCQGKLKQIDNEHDCCLDQPFGFPFGCCSGTDFDDGINCCEGANHNIFTRTCCPGGFSVPHSSFSKEKCCLNKLIDGDHQVCCEGRRPVDKSIGCKSGRGNDTCLAFKENTEFCCSIQFNSMTHMCCNGHVVLKPSGKPTCCGTVSYDLNTQICCTFSDLKPKVFKRVGQMTSCCKTRSKIVVYDTQKHICCEDGSGVTKKVPGLFNCCNRKIFNAGTHGCCFDKMFSLQKFLCDRNTRNLRNKNQFIECCRPGSRCRVLKRQFKEHTECCNGRIMDKRHSKCCGLGIVPVQMECCGKWSGFDNSSDLCCGGVVHTGVIGQSVACCGPVLYDTNTQVCCREDITSGLTPNPAKFIVPRTYGKFTGCCGGQEFDITKFECERDIFNAENPFNLKPQP